MPIWCEVAYAPETEREGERREAVLAALPCTPAPGIPAAWQRAECGRAGEGRKGVGARLRQARVRRGHEVNSRGTRPLCWERTRAQAMSHAGSCCRRQRARHRGAAAVGSGQRIFGVASARHELGSERKKADGGRAFLRRPELGANAVGKEERGQAVGSKACVVVACRGAGRSAGLGRRRLGGRARAMNRTAAATSIGRRKNGRDEGLTGWAQTPVTRERGGVYEVAGVGLGPRCAFPF